MGSGHSRAGPSSVHASGTQLSPVALSAPGLHTVSVTASRPAYFWGLLQRSQHLLAGSPLPLLGPCSPRQRQSHHCLGDLGGSEQPPSLWLLPPPSLSPPFLPSVRSARSARWTSGPRGRRGAQRRCVSLTLGLRLRWCLSLREGPPLWAARTTSWRRPSPADAAGRARAGSVRLALEVGGSAGTEAPPGAAGGGGAPLGPARTWSPIPGSWGVS